MQSNIMYRFKEDYQEFEDTFRLQNSYTTRIHHYKFEHGGMLVYDSKACIVCGNHTESVPKANPELPKMLKPQVRKELETADEKGKR
jgi:hypothetical protein